jgi:hypothetical protein
LRSDPGGGREEVVRSKLGKIASGLRGIGMPEQVAVKLNEPEAPVAASQPEEPRVGQSSPRVAEVQVPSAISLAGESDDRVGAGPDFAVRPTVHVHAKKRERWIGHRIDEIATKPARLRS